MFVTTMTTIVGPPGATVPERVQAGAAWLDERHGPDWHDRIDLDTFSILNCTRCIIGQLDGRDDMDWPNVLARQGIRRWGMALGLGFVGGSDYSNLQEEWERVLRERQGAKVEVTRKERQAVPA